MLLYTLPPSFSFDSGNRTILLGQVELFITFGTGQKLRKMLEKGALGVVKDVSPGSQSLLLVVESNWQLEPSHTHPSANQIQDEDIDFGIVFH